ncbi:MAG: divalent-cation tolerance protein CutA [Candidatus Omnitrophica bacterium]|nr:divalent-cation tolerance protein CutA [Candidatus Omnitrophota bacterium]MDD5027299.1 divalent-cation tolerance protein CutA [Candidatus Omnitrophota bacterium]MDD5662229.1 divalent-cation tolerance protein CutA [Candidatus Omnitrophota bacterium]
MYSLVLITAANKKEAERIAKKLIQDKLAACVSIVSGVESLFWWQGKVDRAKETLLIVKSRKEKFAKIVKSVKARHSYTVPEIIAIPLTNGFKPYLKWIDDSIG